MAENELYLYGVGPEGLAALDSYMNCLFAAVYDRADYSETFQTLTLVPMGKCM